MGWIQSYRENVGEGWEIGPAKIPMAGLLVGDHGAMDRRGRPGPPRPTVNKNGANLLTRPATVSPIKIPLRAINRKDLEASAQATQHTEGDRENPYMGAPWQQ